MTKRIASNARRISKTDIDLNAAKGDLAAASVQYLIAKGVIDAHDIEGITRHYHAYGADGSRHIGPMLPLPAPSDKKSR